ncbi:glycosyltransferase [Chroogloeocystis siderophila]|jgi:colanic acid/amylovoran biosynthesis glycosyltransferase|uniref:Glycosyl transferase n=1 Tax=Chroogloeocystis siderophila 5.2 s.c.1 TaxID=247279 RepID=A0A1U7HVP5_9CHRO|nr:glycosyltransferase [Chroogloeocystis siderophila]OKH27678.1 glycosyl transferase [Chroogloeocystis siderophila 5.2 s.c.1]
MFSEKPAVLIYRDWLLPPSETFVLAQAEALERFIPYYIGSRLIKQGLRTPRERTLLLNEGSPLGWAREACFKIAGFAPSLVTHAKKLNPRLIHAHFGIGGSLALPLKRSLQIPMIVTYHGYEEMIADEIAQKSYFSYRQYMQRREIIKQEVCLFLTVSQQSKEYLLRQGFPSDKIIVHYTGIDTEVFQPEPSIKREPIVLFVARLVEKKGCEYLIRAMSKVQTAQPDMELVIIGDGELRSSLEDMAKASLKKYHFLGVQPPEVVKDWMNRAKIFCVPSITATSGEAEGFGMVFAEAQAMGLPVVSFASGAVPEAVAHGEVGFLAAERHWEELANYILLLAQDQHLWHRFSTYGPQRVRNLFNVQKQAGLLEDIYQQVLIDNNQKQKVRIASLPT